MDCQLITHTAVFKEFNNFKELSNHCAIAIEVERRGIRHRSAGKLCNHCRKIQRCKIVRLPELAYKGLVRPVLEYGSSVWDPSNILLQEELEKVQKKATRFVTCNYIYETWSMTGIPEQLKWESLNKRRRDSRIIMLYKGLKGAASTPTNDLVHPIRHFRKHHSLTFQTPFANTDIYKSSFIPQTI